MERPTATVLCLVVGAGLGFALVFGGFNGLVIVAVFAAVGLLVGRVIDGELDLTDYLSGRGRGRRER